MLLQKWDVAFLMGIPRGPWGDLIMPILTYLGEYGGIWIVLTILLLCWKKTRLIGCTMAIALLFAWITGEYILKLLIARPRPFYSLPELTLLIPPPGSFSFPSGHTASSFAAAFAIFFWRKRIGIVALIIAALIAFSRLYLYVHYPSDVLGGLLLGLFSAIGAFWLIKKWRYKKERPTL